MISRMDRLADDKKEEGMTGKDKVSASVPSSAAPAGAASSPLVVRFRHLHPIAAHSKANVGIAKTTSKYLILVELLNLTFEQESGRNRDSNVKFAPQDGFAGPHRRRDFRGTWPGR
jgi:hypothetical protein